MGYVPLGTVFGFLFVQAGGDAWLAVFSSALVYAGAAQYMMVPMLATGMPISAIAFATLIVNLRHVFYGLSLLDRFRHGNWLFRTYMAFALTDETYSVLTTIPASTPPSRMALIALLNQLWWILGTLIGALIGSRAQLMLAGMDFVLASLFAVLAVEQWRTRASSAPLWVALATYAVAYPIAAKHALSIAIALSIVAAWLFQSGPASRNGGAHD